MSSILKVYGADTCSDCRRAKQYLDSLEVPFDWIDLELRPDEIETVKNLNNGRRTIPVVVFPDGSHLTEPTNAELGAKLGVDYPESARR